MKKIKDLLVTLSVLLLLIIAVAALPAIMGGLFIGAMILVIIGVGWLTYATVHDARIAEERRKADEQRREV